MLDYVFAAVMGALAVGLLVLLIPTVLASWRAAPWYYTLARLALPLLMLAYAGSSLLGLHDPSRPGWATGAFLIGLLLVLLAHAPQMYRPPDSGPQPDRPAREAPAAPPSRPVLRRARPEDLGGAGAVFADTFCQRYDPLLGADRARNARVLADLLAHRLTELVVAVVPDTGQVVGAMWLEMGDRTVTPLTLRQSWSILRRHLSPLHAAYCTLFGLSGILNPEASDRQAYLQWVGVDRAWRGCGLGRQLVEWAVETSRAAGKEALRLHTERRNRPARQLYRRAGFREEAAWPLSARVAYVNPLR